MPERSSTYSVKEIETETLPNRAWVLSKEQAEEICRNRPSDDIMWPKHRADVIASRHVDMQDIPAGFKP